MAKTVTVCAAERHDNLTAYVKYRCRCPKARKIYRDYKRASRAGQPTMVPAIGTTRRLRGLMHYGHSAETIAAVAGIAAGTVYLIAGRANLPPQESVHERTARAVIYATRKLIRIPGRSPAARRWAEQRGWAPLHVWDRHAFPIDDATADEQLAMSTAGLHPVLRRTIRDEAAEAARRVDELAAARRAQLELNATTWITDDTTDYDAQDGAA